jgi:hypothetical protein
MPGTETQVLAPGSGVPSGSFKAALRSFDKKSSARRNQIALLAAWTWVPSQQGFGRVVMSRAERAQAKLESFAPMATAMTTGLAGTLLAVQQRWGGLFMLDMSRCLIEKWDLRCDRLQAQSEETVQLVERILRS